VLSSEGYKILKEIVNDYLNSSPSYFIKRSQNIGFGVLTTFIKEQCRCKLHHIVNAIVSIIVKYFANFLPK